MGNLLRAYNGSMVEFRYDADGKLIALNTQTRDESNKLKNKQVRYLHYDALNSVDMITDGYGNVVERSSYDTWGKKRVIAWQSNSPAEVILSAITNRGYTGHEHIEEVGLIHMNGRVYDQELGRFLSADPHIQAPYLVNSFNRYSYVMNNPLKYTDPTGFFWSEAGQVISSAWSSITSFFSGGSSSGNGSSKGTSRSSSKPTKDNWNPKQEIGGYWTVGDPDKGDYYTSYPSSSGGNDIGNSIKGLVSSINNSRFAYGWAYAGGMYNGAPQSYYDALAPNLDVDTVELARAGFYIAAGALVAKRVAPKVEITVEFVGAKVAKQGGRYGDLVTDGAHRHHMPAQQASPLSKADGPAIRMSPEDHRKTASYGGRKGSVQQAYRDKQADLIKQGKFDNAFMMDVDDIQSKFGNKYDNAILEAMDALP